jgi:two-component system LytT family response regulator
VKKIRTLIVDDERLAREGVATMLGHDAELEIIDYCADGHSALAAIREQKPDLVFMDIQMPRCDGFEVLAALKSEERPAVVFITAYDKYAIQAFEFCAMDYLLKPFGDARFAAALAKAKHDIRQRDTGAQVGKLLAYVQENLRTIATPEARPAGVTVAEPSDRVVLKTGSDLHFIRTADIVWVESQSDFVKVHTTGAAQLVRETLQSLEQRVDPAKFLRIHRSFLVNLDHVKKVTPALYGDYSVQMSDDTKLRLSRKNRGKLKQLIARLSTLDGT